MSQELFEKTVEQQKVAKTRRYNWRWLLILPVWMVLSYFAAQVVSVLLLSTLTFLHISLKSINQSVLVLSLSAFIYLVMICFVIGLPKLIKKYSTTREDIGLTRLPNWKDIFLSPAGLIIYLAASSLLIWAMSSIFPWININQAQDTGFGHLSLRYEYYLAFITLVVLAPVAEEILFRGYLYGKLKKHVPIWAAIVVTSITFGAIHGAWNLAIDTFALSVVMCLLRELTGNIWSSILLHMTKNGIAYYFLFINTTLLTTLGG